MSPILVRPVREQLEHDRLIRHLEGRYKRQYEVALNIGDSRESSIKADGLVLYPDMVMTTGGKVAAVVEVETGESVNNLEAMAQWVHFGRARASFHLYVPVNGYDSAVRLCEALRVKVSEIWTYRPETEGFDLIRMHADAASSRRSSRAPGRAAKATRGAAARKAPAKAPAKASKSKSKAAAAKAAKSKAGARKARVASKGAKVSKAKASKISKATKTKAAKRAAPARKPAARSASAAKKKSSRKGSTGRRR